MTIPDHQFDKLARASRRTALLTLLSFFLVLGSLGYSGYRLHSLQLEVENLERELSIREQQLRQLDDSLALSMSELDRIEQNLDRSRRAAEYIRQGINHYQRGEFSAAISQYRTALEIDPTNYVVYDWMGYAYFRNRQVSEAVESLRRSIEIEPRYASGYYNLSLALWRSGDQSGAVETLRQMLEIDPHLSDVVRSDGQFSQFRQSEEFRMLLGYQ